MAENKMKQVAELLGVEMGVPFNIKNESGNGLTSNPFVLKSDGLYVKRYNSKYYVVLNNLLNGIYEIERPILTEKEKEYLEGVLRPFKDRVEYIEKNQNKYGQWIFVDLKEDQLYLPYFEKDTMYKDMELDKEYTLEELGLFQD